MTPIYHSFLMSDVHFWEVMQERSQWFLSLHNLGYFPICSQGLSSFVWHDAWSVWGRDCRNAAAPSQQYFFFSFKKKPSWHLRREMCMRSRKWGKIHTGRLKSNALKRMARIIAPILPKKWECNKNLGCNVLIDQLKRHSTTGASLCMSTQI